MNPIDAIVALILLVGLLGNRAPAIPIAAIAVVVVRGASTRLTKGLRLGRIEWAIIICLGYWLATYFWANQSLSNLLSFGFLRHDGAMLVSYTAFFFLLGWPLKPSQCRAFWVVFATVLAVVGFAGAAISLNLPHSGVFSILHVVGLEEYVSGFGAGTAGGAGQMFFGWYEAHNTAGGVYAVVSVVLLALLQDPKLSLNQKTFRWILLACCLMGLGVTYSRGAYLAFMGGAAAVLPLRKLSGSLKSALLVGALITVIVTMNSQVMDRFDTLTDPYYQTSGGREYVWALAEEDFLASPIVGIGFGRFNDDFQFFKGVKHFVYVVRNAKTVNDDEHAHNSYLHFLAEGGIIGLLVTMYVWLSSWKVLSFYAAHLPRSKLLPLLNGAKGGLMVALVQALTEHTLGRGSVLLVVGTLIGSTIATARIEARGAKVEEEHAPLAPPTRSPALRMGHEPVGVR